MIGDDAEGKVIALVLAVAAAALALGEADDVLEQVGIVVRRDALQHRRQALQTCSGIDVLGRQLFEAAIFSAVVLDEDEVPQLHEARAADVDGAHVPGHVLHVAQRRAAIDVDLGARATRTDLAHLPEIILLVEALDVRRVDVGEITPQGFGLAVGAVDGGVELVLGKLPHLGDELPGPGDRFLLVVVAERPVAEHLEEGVVVAVAPDLLDVVVLAAQAQTFLRIDRARVGELLIAEEDVLELHHPGVDEQQGRVLVRNQRRAGNEVVAALAEKFDELGADLGTGHGRECLASDAGK